MAACWRYGPVRVCPRFTAVKWQTFCGDLSAVLVAGSSGVRRDQPHWFPRDSGRRDGPVERSPGNAVGAHSEVGQSGNHRGIHHLFGSLLRSAESVGQQANDDTRVGSDLQHATRPARGLDQPGAGDVREVRTDGVGEALLGCGWR